MPDPPRISVALATYNAERYLGELLDSLVRQTRMPYELVVHDDASEDSTLARLEEFATAAPFPVRVERGETRRGPTDAFIAAARRCEGDVVAFCDHDDVWLERKLEVCSEELTRTGAQLVMHSARLVDAGLRPLGHDWPAIKATRLVPRLALTGLDTNQPGMAMAFRRELLDLADFDSRPPSRYGGGKRMLHDEWVFFLAGVVGPIRLVAEPLVLYRQHASNDSGGWVDRRRELSLRPAMDDYRRAAEHTSACADYLAAVGSPVLAEGADEYRRAAANWRLRASLYATQGRRSRARVFRQLVAGRAYRARTTGGFGRVAFGKDLAAGVALAVPAPDER
jgi:glycosyltransferase involved in cell wall biosynthesis